MTFLNLYFLRFLNVLLYLYIYFISWITVIVLAAFQGHSDIITDKNTLSSKLK